MKEDIANLKKAVTTLAECIDKIEWSMATDIQKQMRVHNKIFRSREKLVKEILEGKK